MLKINSKRVFSTLILSGLVWMLFSCGAGDRTESSSESTALGPQQTIMVFAAASLSDVISEVIDSFELKYPVQVQTNLASSGTLARQTTQGGEPDLVLLASTKWADYLDSLGYIAEGSKISVARNELVLIAPRNSALEVSLIDSTLDFLSLLGKGRLSIGDPAHVPAGMYAQQALEYFGWYEGIKGRTLPARDARSALMMVEMEEAPLGIVYRTDAEKSTKIKILNAFPDNTHEPIVYVSGLCKDNPTSRAFLEYVKSHTTSSIWTKYGFKTN